MKSVHASNYEHKSSVSSSSETSSSKVLSNTGDHSDEEKEILLASARPKRRAGRRIFKETRHPVYRGVRRRNNNKWVCEVRVPNDNSTRIWLGTYPTPDMAARAHDVAALAFKGKSACLNFADSAWRLPLPASTNAKEIRRVAAEAAEAFAVTDWEVCSSSDNGVSGSVMEDDNKKPLQGLYVDEVVPAEPDMEMHDWLRSMADEPLRSPPHLIRYASSTRDWIHDMDQVDVEEVSLWSFSI